MTSMRTTLSVLAILVTSSIAVSAQETVSFDLRLISGTGVLCPGETVDWEIWVEVTTQNNAGLALACVDLIQHSSNPDKFDIPYAAGIPVGMSNFSRPAGISNPGEGGHDSGYVGVQRGAAGEMNLVQIGGGQNTFGIAGQVMGTNPDVTPNVGVGAPVVLAAGSFVAPTTPGTYILSLNNALANVMTEANTPPNHSPVVGATVTFVSESMSFIIPVAGDLNGDGYVNISDLAGLLGNYGMPSGASCREGDVDGDGDVDLSDLAALLGNYGIQP